MGPLPLRTPYHTLPVSFWLDPCSAWKEPSGARPFFWISLLPILQNLEVLKSTSKHKHHMFHFYLNTPPPEESFELVYFYVKQNSTFFIFMKFGDLSFFSFNKQKLMFYFSEINQKSSTYVLFKLKYTFFFLSEILNKKRLIYPAVCEVREAMSYLSSCVWSAGGHELFIQLLVKCGHELFIQLLVKCGHELGPLDAGHGGVTQSHRQERLTGVVDLTDPHNTRGSLWHYRQHNRRRFLTHGGNRVTDVG